ncbi:MAG: glycosyltransferase N-terminal domain-containing protein [Rikenellaceae bacterium]
MFIYNIGIFLLGFLFRLASLFNPKAKLWVRGRKNWKRELESALKGNVKPVAWVHAASLGEFEQGREVIEKIKEQYADYFVLLTFFSPSGYTVRKNYDKADYVCYLPLDTPSNAKAFARIVKPKVAIFVKYEFWINLLNYAYKGGCRLYVVSAIFRQNSIFFRFYGGIFRKLLNRFSQIFVQNMNSKQLLKKINVENVVVSGDTRFDRVHKIASLDIKLDIVEKFVGSTSCLVAGSTWAEDEKILVDLIEKNKDVKFIIAPHELDSKRIDKLREKITGESCLYTLSTSQTDFSDAQVMIIDTIGVLSKVYKYGSWAYIGGGFGVGIHNTLEAATFSLPLAFGLNYHKFFEACAMVDLGVARSVANADELISWFESVDTQSDNYKNQRKDLANFVAGNLGASDKIVAEIFAKNR